MEIRVGERPQDTLFQAPFNRAAVVTSAGSELTGDAGAIVLRQAAELLDVRGALGGLDDPRDPDMVEYPLDELLLSRILFMGQGWEDQDDLDTLRADPAFRVATSLRRGLSVIDRAIASQPTMSRTMANLGSDHNRGQLATGLLAVGLRRAREDRLSTDSFTVDFDSFPVSAHGEQEGVRYNGHYHEDCYHPLAAFADTGDLLAIDLRPGNVHTATDARAFMEPVLLAAKEQFRDVWARIDAGFASGPMFDWLDQIGVTFLTRLKGNSVLQERVRAWKDGQVAQWRRSRVDGAEPREATYEFWYAAKGWSRVRRVVAVLVERNDREGELFEDLFFLATNARRSCASSAALLERYRKRGLAEQRIGEFVREFVPNLSSATLAVNEAALRVAALAYQVAHFIRRRIEKARGTGLSLRRLRERFLKTPALCLRHAGRLVFRIGLAYVDRWRELANVLVDPPAVVADVEVATR